MQETKVKKTYSTPSLQRLGAVKDLTAGGSDHHPKRKRRKHRHCGHRR